MQSLNSFKTNVFRINNQNFGRHALELFHFQYNNNKTYQEYVQHLNVRPGDVTTISKIPFLPIQFFKYHKVKTGNFSPQHMFESSGTTGSTSKHYIEDLGFYKNVSTKIFNSFFGEIDQSIIIGLLPSFLERDNSSLVYMVNHFMQKSKNSSSGFYLDNFEILAERLRSFSEKKLPVFLFGVTFALLEFAKRFQLDMKNLFILETGGMKGRGKELIREELHQILKGAFNTNFVFSEYGMTELLSQAYLQRDGLFHTPPWMRVLIREIHDPFSYAKKGQTGVIKVIDMANIHSCAFIETEDMGLLVRDGFKVIGRLDNSDLRGCNLLLP